MTIPTGPIAEAPWDAIPNPGPLAPQGTADAMRRQVLLDALDGVELGAYDHQIMTWMAQWDGPTVATVASWLLRARQAGRAEAAREQGTAHAGAPTVRPDDPAADRQAQAEAIRALAAAAERRAAAQTAEREATEQLRQAVLAAREAGVPVRRIVAHGDVSIATIDRWWRLRFFWGAAIIVYAADHRGPSWGSGLASRIRSYTVVGRRADGTPLTADDARTPLDQQEPRDDDDVLRILGDAYPGADIDLVYDGPDRDDTAPYDAYDDEDGAGEDQTDDSPEPIVTWEITCTVREEEDEEDEEN